MKVRLIGDIHGVPKVINDIAQSVNKYDLTIQLGDFGVGFPKYKNQKTPEEFLKDIPSNKLKILAGNHDNFEVLKTFSHSLEKFGFLHLMNTGIFYVSGAMSIDRHQRTEGVDWWPHEELSYQEGIQCLKYYQEYGNEINIVLSHDCPDSIFHMLTGKSDTSITRSLLTEMYNSHQPREWYFGHYHKQFTKRYGNTLFKCLDINQEFVIDVN